MDGDGRVRCAAPTQRKNPRESQCTESFGLRNRDCCAARAVLRRVCVMSVLSAGIEACGEDSQR